MYLLCGILWSVLQPQALEDPVGALGKIKFLQKVVSFKILSAPYDYFVEVLGKKGKIICHMNKPPGLLVF